MAPLLLKKIDSNGLHNGHGYINETKINNLAERFLLYIESYSDNDWSSREMKKLVNQNLIYQVCN